MPSHRSIVIFSGGTAANHLVDVFESIRKSKECPLSYIIPISDNGGSSSELIRVFGGPGIGDVRSRLVRLIPRLPQGSPGFKEREAIRALFNYRLSSTDGRMAKLQWTEVVDGTSELWKDISSAKKELIRSLFNLVNSEITKRSRPPVSTFDFTSASVGNLFLTGARLFSGSFESAIYLLGSICGVEDEFVKVIPSINSNFSHHIAAGLEDGTVIVGQNAISHPSPNTIAASPETTRPRSTNGTSIIVGDEPTRRHSESEHYYGDEHEILKQNQEEEEDANLPGSLPTLRTRNIVFNKEAHLNEDLPARISRIWYINPYGQEILPPANPRAVQALANAQAVIYSIGSLYTSLVPSLILRGIGEALHRNTFATGARVRTKILILNGCLDREVGPQPPHNGAHSTVFSAVDFVEAIVKAGEQSRGVAWQSDHSQSETIDVSTSITPDHLSSTKPANSIEKEASPTKKRPQLLSSKSESILRTSLKSPQSSGSNVLPQQRHHLFPPPLPASAAPSRNPSREPSPISSPSTTPTDTTPAWTKNKPDMLSSSTATHLLPLPSLSSSDGSISRPGTPLLLPQSKPDRIYNHYVTHLIHLPNSPGTPHVDRDLLRSKYGIQCIKVYGRSSPSGPSDGMRYDPSALRGAIEALLGRRAEREPPTPSGGVGTRASRRERSVTDKNNGNDSASQQQGTVVADGRDRSSTFASAVAGNTSTTGADDDDDEDGDDERTWRARGMPRRNTVENNGRWVSLS